LFHLVFESHDGRALVPIPKRSTSLRATSTLEWWIGLKALDPDRPIREAMIGIFTGALVIAGLFAFWPGRIMHAVVFGS
jgi:hypothetical protein